MTRIVTCSLAWALLLQAGVALGAEQTQGTTIDTGDHIWLQQGVQAADTVQNLAVLVGQQMDGATQTLVANVGGVGQATSEGAEIGVIRSLEVSGWQGQILGGPCGPRREDQNHALEGLLSVGMTDGAGAADALHQIVLSKDQAAMDLSGISTATASTLGLQKAELTGFTGTLSGVETSMFSDTVQSQIDP
ncbi:MAG: hypothetical protein A2Y77_05895 [Planctomycetes bacterium RBG_13_62_9]|nr:MAG: hypothetical protein A2Y77_05895 [Planctomycetes bacterium RBG_13_62_9]